jgi:hypothetical protein
VSDGGEKPNISYVNLGSRSQQSQLHQQALWSGPWESNKVITIRSSVPLESIEAAISARLFRQLTRHNVSEGRNPFALPLDRVIDNVQPAKDAVKDHPKNRMINAP